jgi:hypothetical protein
MIDINNLTNTEAELQELNLATDYENYLQDLSEQEEINIKGRGGPPYIDPGYLL